MRKLWLSSAFAVAILMGLLIGVATIAEIFTKTSDAPMPILIGIALFFVGLQFLLGPYLIRLIMKINWVEPSEVSPEFAAWYAATGAELKIGSPKLGIIESGMPNAFTFGRFVKDARVVVTRGLVDSLDEQELRAVVAHEFGHIRNRDFIAMTLVQALVLVIYYIARLMLEESDGRAKIGGVVAYMIYWVAQLGALAFSRIREFMADRVSAEAIRDPDALASALVKIGYGLAHMKMEEEEPNKSLSLKVRKKAKHPALGAGALGAWGISPVASFNSVVGWCGADGRPTPEAFGRVSAWDLKNAWARYRELLSTHPLITRRVGALMALPQSRRTFEVGNFEKPNWSRFLQEWMIFAFPTLVMMTMWIALLAREIGNPLLLSGGFVALFGGLMVRMMLVYPKKAFSDRQIVDLLSDTEASHISPIPCTLHGKFVTRAEGGLWWSANLVFQDESGIIVAQRKLFLPPWMTSWGWLRARQFVSDHEVTLTGWYRRFGHPTIEINTVNCPETQESFKSPYWNRSMIALGVCTAISLLIFVLAMLG